MRQVWAGHAEGDHYRDPQAGHFRQDLEVAAVLGGLAMAIRGKKPDRRDPCGLFRIAGGNREQTRFRAIIGRRWFVHLERATNKACCNRVASTSLTQNDNQENQGISGDAVSRRMQYVSAVTKPTNSLR
jgi:hypothetical protein